MVRWLITLHFFQAQDSILLFFSLLGLSVLLFAFSRLIIRHWHGYLCSKPLSDNSFSVITVLESKDCLFPPFIWDLCFEISDLKTRNSLFFLKSSFRQRLPTRPPTSPRNACAQGVWKGSQIFCAISCCNGTFMLLKHISSFLEGHSQVV